jgi:hypothetical protein
MPGRIGGAAIALGLIVSLSDVLAQERVEPALERQPIPTPEQEERGNASQHDHSSPEQDSPSELLPGIQGIEAAIRSLVAPEDEAKRERQENREIADLQAQNNMAFWAMLMFFATVVATLVTAAGVYLIYRTLRYTKTMAVDTQRTADAAVVTADEASKGTAAATRAADAALEANKINRDVFRAERRAWIGVKQGDIIVTTPLEWTDGGGAFMVRMIARNIGSSPAHGVWFDSDIYLDKRDSRLFLETIMGRARNEAVAHSPHTIFPNDKLNLGRSCGVHKHAVDAHAKHVSDKTKTAFDPDRLPLHIYLFGCVDYGILSSDERRRTAFIAKVIGLTNGGVLPIYRCDGVIPAGELRVILEEVTAD